MLYLVIERFKDAAAIYARLREHGRLMPDDLEYIDSWIDHDLKTCWQIMRAANPSLFEPWMANWRDLMDFEIVPVKSSAEVAELMRAQTIPPNRDRH